MKILAIIGSPKGKGNTYNLVRRVETRMRQMHDDVAFEYILLKEANLGLCRGCFQCVLKGEERCPLRDDRAAIEENMLSADGVILASPVYEYNVSWIMKNFIDRYAYVAHRPRYHGKKAMVVATTGAVGLELTLPLLALHAGFWGFTVVHRLGARCPPTPLPAQARTALEAKTARDVDRAAGRFLEAILRERTPPSLIQLGAFMFQQRAFAQGRPGEPDYDYWYKRGWLEKDTTYAYDVQINPIVRMLARIAARAMWAAIPKSSDRPLGAPAQAPSP